MGASVRGARVCERVLLSRVGAFSNPRVVAGTSRRGSRRYPRGAAECRPGHGGRIRWERFPAAWPRPERGTGETGSRAVRPRRPARTRPGRRPSGAKPAIASRIRLTEDTAMARQQEQRRTRDRAARTPAGQAREHRPFGLRHDDDKAPRSTACQHGPTTRAAARNHSPRSPRGGLRQEPGAVERHRD